MLAMHRTEPSSASVPLLGYVRASKESKLAKHVRERGTLASDRERCESRQHLRHFLCAFRYRSVACNEECNAQFASILMVQQVMFIMLFACRNVDTFSSSSKRDKRDVFNIIRGIVCQTSHRTRRGEARK
jgi:hypothetical protein